MEGSERAAVSRLLAELDLPVEICGPRIPGAVADSIMQDAMTGLRGGAVPAWWNLYVPPYRFTTLPSKPGNSGG